MKDFNQPYMANSYVILKSHPDLRYNVLETYTQIKKSLKATGKVTLNIQFLQNATSQQITVDEDEIIEYKTLSKRQKSKK